MTGHDAAELQELEVNLADLGWTLFASDPSGLLRAERGGTFRHEQAGMTPAALLAAVEAAEARLEANLERANSAGVAVQVGLASTTSHQPLKGA